MSRYLIIALSLTPFLSASATANEPGWTEAERTEKRDVVIEGKVLSVKKLQKINEREDLYVAEVKISKRHKGADKLPDVIKVHFEFSNTGKNLRHPAYAELAKGTAGKFFLVNCNEAVKKRIGMEESKDRILLIELGSDVFQAGPGKAGNTGK